MKVLVVMVMVVVAGVGRSVMGELTLAPGSPFCTTHPTFLTCDYKDTQETVVMGKVETPKVYIHNAKKIEVLEDMCTSLAFFNTASITFRTSITCPHTKAVSLKLVNSNSNLVPSHVSHLEMQDSDATNVVCNNIRQFTVVNSDIGTLEITQPIRTMNAKFEHSTINLLKKIWLEEKAQLIFFNVTVNTAGRHSLYLKDSSGSIWTSDFKHAHEQAIVLDTKSTLVVKGIENRLTFAGPQEVEKVTSNALPKPKDDPKTPKDTPTTPKIETEAPKDKPTSPKLETEAPVNLISPEPELRPPGVPSSTIRKENSDCPRSSALVWILPLVLAVCEAVIIIINCTNWFPRLKVKHYKKNLEDGGRIAGGTRAWAEPDQMGVNHSYPAWYYSSEVSNQNNNTYMRQRMDNNAI